MSKPSLAPRRGKRKPPEHKPPDAPTDIELAERCVLFVDYAICQSHNLVEVLVAAEKTARALHLAILGLDSENEHTSATDEDFGLLGEMAGGLSLFCTQAKKLIAEGQAAATPARAA